MTSAHGTWVRRSACATALVLVCMAAGSVAGAAQAAAPGSAAGRPLGWPDPLYLCVGLLIVGVITLVVGLYGLRRADRAG